MKKVFSIASNFIGLHCYQLGAKNLDLLVLLVKNWHDDLNIWF
jgi:hypothetical protein